MRAPDGPRPFLAEPVKLIISGIPKILQYRSIIITRESFEDEANRRSSYLQIRALQSNPQSFRAETLYLPSPVRPSSHLQRDPEIFKDNYHAQLQLAQTLGLFDEQSWAEFIDSDEAVMNLHQLPTRYDDITASINCVRPVGGVTQRMGEHFADGTSTINIGLEVPARLLLPQKA